MSLFIEKESILNCEVDAIVNAANVNLERGGGVCVKFLKRQMIKLWKKSAGVLHQ